MKVKIEMGAWPEGIAILTGGDPSSPSWEEYLQGFEEEFRPRLVAMREAVERAGLVGRSAELFCNSHYFLFEDGLELAFSWRAWGDFMQALVGKNEGYMQYYM